MRHTYWATSKFANWIRGTKKPSSATAEGWAEWRAKAKTSHPIRYWIADEGLKHAQNVVYYIPTKLHDIRCYLDNRFVSQTHALVAHKSSLQRGQWRDVDNRFLPCLFDTLVDFVEIELASEIFWHNESYKVPFWDRLPFMQWRSREAGIENLKWQMSLVYDEHNGFPDKNDPQYGLLTDQAIRAKEVLDLYLWWKDVYPKRPEPYAASGWSAYCDEKRKLAKDGEDDFFPFFSNKNIPEDMKERGDKANKLLETLEEQYEQEDTDMMVRLIKIRHSLWT